MTRLTCPKCADAIELEIDIPPGRAATVTCARCGHAFKATADGVIKTARAPAGEDDSPLRSGPRSKGPRPDDGEAEPRRPRREQDDDRDAEPADSPPPPKRTLLIAIGGGALSLALGLGIGLLVFGGAKGTTASEKPRAKGGDIAKLTPAPKGGGKIEGPGPAPKDKPKDPPTKDNPKPVENPFPPGSVDYLVRQLRDSKTRTDDLKDAARKLAEKAEKDSTAVQVAVPDLLSVLLKSSDTQVQDLVFAALEKIKKPADLDRSLITQALKSPHILAQMYAVGLLGGRIVEVKINGKTYTEKDNQRKEREKVEQQSLLANREEYLEVFELAKQAHQRVLDGANGNNRDLVYDRKLLARTFGTFIKYGLDCKQDVIDMLFKALEDSDPDVCSAAGLAVDSFIDATHAKDPKGSPFDKRSDTPRLKDALRNSKSPELRRVAAYAYRVMPDSANEAFAFYTVELLSNEKDPEVLRQMVLGLTVRWSKDRGIERYRESINKLSGEGNDGLKQVFIQAVKQLPLHKSTNDRVIALLTSAETTDEIKEEAFNVLIQKLDIPTGKSDADREVADEQLRLVISLLSNKDRDKQLEDLRTKSEQGKGLNDEDLKKYETIYSRRTLETKQLVDKLAKFGPSAGSATADLVGLFKTRNSFIVRTAILKTLRQIGKDAAKHAVTAIQDVLAPKDDAKNPFVARNEEAEGRRLAWLVQKPKAGEKPFTFSDAFREAYAAHSSELFLEGVATLATFGEEALDALVATVGNRGLSDDVRGNACLALADIGIPAQEKAIPKLIVLAETNANLRDTVFKAVTKLGGDELAAWLLEQQSRNKTPETLQAWAYTVMADLDLKTIKTKDLLAKMGGRLKAASENHPNASCKEAAKVALKKYEKALAELNKK